MNQPTSISWNVTGGFCWRCSDGRPKNWMHQRQSHPLHNGFNRPQKNFHQANRANKPNFCRKIQGMLVRSHFFGCGKDPTGKPHGPVDIDSQAYANGCFRFQVGASSNIPLMEEILQHRHPGRKKPVVNFFHQQ